MEIPGFTPKREEKKVEGGWLVSVTAPPFMKLPTQTLKLTDDQYNRYQQWRMRRLMIQEALPDLSMQQREILMTGIGPDDWNHMFPDED